MRGGGIWSSVVLCMAVGTPPDEVMECLAITGVCGGLTVTIQMCCCVVLNVHGIVLYKAGSTLGFSLRIMCIVNKMQPELTKFKVAVIIHDPSEFVSEHVIFSWDRKEITLNCHILTCKMVSGCT